MKAIDSSVEQGLNLFHGFRDNHTSQDVLSQTLKETFDDCFDSSSFKYLTREQPFPLSHNPVLIVVLATAAD